MNRRAFIAAALAGAAAVGVGTRLDALREWLVFCGDCPMELFRSGTLRIGGARRFSLVTFPIRMSSLSPTARIVPLYGASGSLTLLNPEWTNAPFEAVFQVDRWTSEVRARFFDRTLQKLL